MGAALGGLKVSANTTKQSAPVSPAKYTQGWAAVGTSKHGQASVTASATNSKLTLTAGVYRVRFVGSVESHTDATPTGENVVFWIYYGGAVATDDVPSRTDFQGDNRPVVALAEAIIEVTAAQVLAATNYVEVYIGTDSSPAVDFLVRDALFTAERLDQ